MHFDPAKRPANCREFMEDVLGTGWRTMHHGSSGSMLTTQFLVPGSLALPDADSSMNTEPPMPLPEDIWYMVYKDSEAKTHTVKGSTRSIRKNLTLGTLGDLSIIIVSRTKTGQFQPLGTIPEFRDLAMQAGVAKEALKPPTPKPPQTPSKRGSPGLVDTPYDGKTPTIPNGASKPGGLGAPSAEDSPTEKHVIQPLRKKSKADNPKVFPSAAIVPKRADDPVEAEAAPEGLSWWPFAVLGAVLLALVLVVVFLLTK